VIIDAILLRDSISVFLKNFFISEKFVKVFHGGENDIRWLKNDFNIDVLNILDTSRAELILKGKK